MEEVVHASGHEHVSAEHASTVEVTTDDFLTPAGDCILAVEADRAPADFGESFGATCADAAATIVATIDVEGKTARVEGEGHPDLTFASERSAVARTSTYVDDRTVMVGADAAARDIDREMVDALAAGADLRLRLAVE
jgi:hypothetical protein